MLKIILLVILACIYSWIVYEIGYCEGFQKADELEREHNEIRQSKSNE